jgi:hypothetical protein
LRAARLGRAVCRGGDRESGGTLAPRDIGAGNASRPVKASRSPDWLKMKNADAPAVKREAEEDWGRWPHINGNGFTLSSPALPAGFSLFWWCGGSGDPAMTPLILKRASASRSSGQWRDDDYVVLEDGVVMGRIFKVPVAPPDRPWMWASGPSAGSVARAAHGYEATREAAMAAFAKNWRRQ